MDKKPLIVVSICAVILLILGSLSNVMGYQSVKSTTVSDSPLFSIRTQRATNQQQNSITSQYIGMGKGNQWQFPIIDNRTEQMKKAIDIISKMDDKTFERFTELCIQRVQQESALSDMNSNVLVKTLHLLRTKPVTIINSFINRNNYNLTSSNNPSICAWFPGCISRAIFFYISMTIIYLIVTIHFYITSKTCMLTCTSESFCFGSLCMNQNKQYFLEE